jgi:hypothetical protein
MARIHIVIGLHILYVCNVIGPLPNTNRVERAVVPTLQQFFDEVNQILRDIQRHSHQVDIFRMYQRLDIAARHMRDIRLHITVDRFPEAVRAQFQTAETAVESVLAEIRRLRQDQAEGMVIVTIIRVDKYPLQF